MKWKEEDHPRVGKGNGEKSGQFAPKEQGGRDESKIGSVDGRNFTTGKPKNKKSKIVQLDKKEYASFCSTIRTRNGNKIPPRGDLLNGNHYYRYAYDKKEERIVCTLRLPIQGNEERIMKLRKGMRYGI